MVFQESETVELKEIIVEDIKKEVLAFANSNGGTLYIGVSDDGSVVGVEKPDRVIQQISNMIRDSIKPDITMFIHYETKNVEEKSIVSIEIQRGSDRPYYLAKKGLRPEGVYVRQGTSSVPATESAIRRMIKDTDGESFEDMRSLEQNLTFTVTETEFRERNIEFGITQKKTLGILNTDSIYTNLGLLLSDQCAHTVKAAVFEGTDQSVFRDRKEFSGSLLQQMNEAYEYIDRRNQVRSTFQKLQRMDERDYPEVAIREVLLNSLVHRDYSFRASTLISIYEDRMEFVTIGGLPEGISLEDIMLGLSVCRNSGLANVFYRMGLIEAYGTGMKKIMNAYEKGGKQPLIEVSDHAFKVVLFNRNFDFASTRECPEKESERNILEFVRRNGFITRKETEKVANISKTAAGRLLREMVEKAILIQKGQGKNTRYTL